MPPIHRNGSDPGNIRPGFAIDCMNPYSNLRSKHSWWPVLVIIYNLLYSLCMKRKYMVLSMTISGPRQPRNEIDVYLSPLIEDLNFLWDQGVEVFDAYENLSGYSVKRHSACPIVKRTQVTIN